MWSRVAVISIVLMSVACCLRAEEPKAHPVKPSELAAALAQADKIAIYDGRLAIYSDGRPAPAKVLYETENADDLSAFREAAAVDAPKEWFQCACLPVVDIKLFSKGKEIGWIGVYELGGLAIGFTGWDGNAWPKDKKKLLSWFDERGITAPHEAVYETEREIREIKEASQRWLEAMPASLRPLWPKAMPDQAMTGSDPNRVLEAAADLLQPALEEELPDGKARVRALLTWFGSGEGPWTGYPAYEDVAARLLLRCPQEDLLEALEGVPLTPAQMEGAARFFAGYNDSLSDQVPDGIKKALLDHVMRSGDDDKMSRARSAFVRE